MYMWKCPSILWRRNAAFWKRSVHSSSGKNGPNTSNGLRKVLYDLKSSSSDEELRKNIAEFENKLKELQESEKLHNISDAISKGMNEISARNQALAKELQELGTKIGQLAITASKPLQEAAKLIKPLIPDVSQSHVVKGIGKAVESAEESISQSTNMYQYGGYRKKESRAKIFDAHKIEPKPISQVAENPDAGSSIVHVPQSISSSIWQRFKEVNPAAKLFSYLKKNIENSDNVFIYFGRELGSSIQEKFGSVFSESETAQTIRKLRRTHPNFTSESFLKLSREYLVPEILDAFILGDLATLRPLCSESAYSVLESTLKPSLELGYTFHGQVVDLRNLDVVAAKVIDDRPIIVLSFQTQQMSYVKDGVGKIVDGSEGNLDNVHYVMAFTPEEPVEQDSIGWKLVEIAVRDRNGGW